MLDISLAATPNGMRLRLLLEESGLGWALADVPGIARWFEAIRQRPATLRAFADDEDPYARPRHPDLQEETA